MASGGRIRSQRVRTDVEKRRASVHWLNGPTFEGRCDDKSSFRDFRVRHRLRVLASLAAAVCFFATASAPLPAGLQTPQDAVDALIAAARNGDEKSAALRSWPCGDDISSGDKVADEATHKHFVNLYDAKHESR